MPIASPELARFIAAYLPLTPAPSVPEIRLHRAGPRSGLWRLAEQDQQGFGPPYWAHHWGGGLALARYILDHPETVAARSVLDLGTGSGIVAIAAAKARARAVIAADIDRYALAALQLNATANAVMISTLLADPTGAPPPAVDLVCIGDLFYEPSLAARVTAFLERCLAAGIEVLIGDPWRAFLPRARLRLITEYLVSDLGDGVVAGTRSAVFAFAPPTGRYGSSPETPPGRSTASSA